MTTAAISKYINGRTPDETALRKIAKALNLPADFVFEKAGVLPPKPELSPIKRALIHLAEGMPDSDIEVAIAVLEQREEYYRKNPSARPVK